MHKYTHKHEKKTETKNNYSRRRILSFTLQCLFSFLVWFFLFILFLFSSLNIKLHRATHPTTKKKLFKKQMLSFSIVKTSRKEEKHWLQVANTNNHRFFHGKMPCVSCFHTENVTKYSKLKKIGCFFELESNKILKCWTYFNFCFGRHLMVSHVCLVACLLSYVFAPFSH